MKTSKTPAKPKKIPAFVQRAERAMLRAGQNVIRQNQAHKLPLILWLDGKLVEKEV